MSDDLFADPPEVQETGMPEGLAAGVAGEGAGAGRTLGNEPAGAGLVGYREKQSVYAARYGYGIRTIKLWIAEGRAAEPVPKPPPLDDAEAMLGWWGEVKSNSVPPRLLAAAETARQARLAVTNPTPAATVEAAPGAPAASAIAGDAAPPEKKPLAIGFSATLERVRQAEAEASARYLDAFNKPIEERDDSKTSRLRREWSELSEQLRFLEKAAPEVLAKSGEILTKQDVRRILVKLHGPIVSGVRALFRRTRSKAPAGASLDDLERIYGDEVERLFGDLLGSEFAPG